MTCIRTLLLFCLCANGCNEPYQPEFSEALVIEADGFNPSGPDIGAGLDTADGDATQPIDTGEDPSADADAPEPPGDTQADPVSDDTLEPEDIQDAHTTDPGDAGPAPDGGIPDLHECGDGILGPDEACDDGDRNSDSDPNTCREDCTPPRCGDGVTDDGEACDGAENCSDECELPAAPPCEPCVSDGDCGHAADLCLDGECGLDCTTEDCPTGFLCRDGQCRPESGSCDPCLDDDGDGFGLGGECAGPDCDDTDPDRNPAAHEVCDEVDNDCDSRVDEGTLLVWFADRDGDGWGDGDDSIDACGLTEVYSAVSPGDCNDEDGGSHPDAAEVCDGHDNDCDPDTLDGTHEPSAGRACDGEDGDLCAAGTTSCIGGQQICTGDTPSPAETCNGVDDDCDGAIDEGTHSEWFADNDGDGWGAEHERSLACSRPDGFVAAPGDCDDVDPERNPGATELCAGTDDDCDGLVDCADPECAESAPCVFDCEFESVAVDTRRVAGSTTGTSGQVGSCGGGGPEHPLLWTAPSTGDFRISTRGSSFDTVLYVLESCDGPERACNDDGFSGADRFQSAVDVSVVAGERLLIVVDGFDASSSGEFVVEILPADEEAEDCSLPGDEDSDGAFDCADSDCHESVACCPPTLLDGTGEVARGNTATGLSVYTGSCGGSGPEVPYRYRAAETAVHQIRAVSTSFPNVIVYDDCGGSELSCSLGASAEVPLVVGQEILIVVDTEGFAGGPFGLQVTIPEHLNCSDERDNDGDGLVDCADPSCGGAPDC